jgi:hypothetical protein
MVPNISGMAATTADKMRINRSSSNRRLASASVVPWRPACPWIGSGEVGWSRQLPRWRDAGMPDDDRVPL